MLNLSCENRKMGNLKTNGPILPVWKSLKGFRNKDSVPQLSSKHHEFTGDDCKEATADNLERVYSCHTDSRKKRELFKNEPSGNHKSFPEIGYKHKDESQLETPTLHRYLWDLNSSATNTNLSQETIELKSNSLVAASSTKESCKEDIEEEEESDNAMAFNFLKDIPLLLFTDVYRQTRVNSKKMSQRIVQKSGECNVTQSNVARRGRRYLQDIFTTLVDMQWRWTLLVFATSFLMSWLIFALVWYSIALFHGDLLPERSPLNQKANGWTPCVINIFSFTSCFLFSVETQHTIGYGSRYTTEECPEAILVVCIQSIVGVMIQAFMVGVVFAKLSRPKKRTQTLIFSRNCCICQRDGELCLIFRVGDLRKSHIIEAHIRSVMIRRRVTDEGEVLPFYQYELDVGYDVGEDRIFFVWPLTIIHKIDESSPLYDISAHDLLREKFEIVVMLEGVIESTGMTTQARSSYLPNEVLWGYRFEPLLFFKKDTGEYTVDYSLFNSTRQVTTPLCSAKHLHECNVRDSSSVSSIQIPYTSITPQVTPINPDCRNYGLDKTNAKPLSNMNSNEKNNIYSIRSMPSSSSTLKGWPSCATFEDDPVSQNYSSSLSEVIISQPLFNATNQL